MSFKLKIEPTKLSLKSPEFMAQVRPQERAVLMKMGSFVRRTAMQSMRTATVTKTGKTPSSKPGQPPRAHPPHAFLKEKMLFLWDAVRRAVVIGPAPIDAPWAGHGIPGKVEHGDQGGRQKNLRRRFRKLGQCGEIRIVTAKAVRKMKKTRPVNHPWLKKNKDGKWIAYAKLTSPAMVQRSNELNEELYGPDFVNQKPNAARPYMGPALEKELENMPSLWKDSIRAKAS